MPPKSKQKSQSSAPDQIPQDEINRKNCKISYADTKHDFSVKLADKIISEGTIKVTPASVNCSKTGLLRHVELPKINENSIFKLVLECYESDNSGVKLDFDGIVNLPTDTTTKVLKCKSINPSHTNDYSYDMHKHTKSTFAVGNYKAKSEGLPIMIKLGLHKLITHTNGIVNIVFDATSGSAFKRCFQNANSEPQPNKYFTYFNTPQTNNCREKILLDYVTYKNANTMMLDEPGTVNYDAPLTLNMRITTKSLYAKTMFQGTIQLRYILAPQINSDPATKPKIDSTSWKFNKGANFLLKYHKYEAPNTVCAYNTSHVSCPGYKFFSNIAGRLSYRNPASQKDLTVDFTTTPPAKIYQDMNAISNISNVNDNIKGDTFTKENAMYVQFKKMGDQNQALFILNLPDVGSDPTCNSRNTFLLTNDRMLLAFCLANGISCGITIGRSNANGLSSVITFIKKI